MEVSVNVVIIKTLHFMSKTMKCHFSRQYFSVISHFIIQASFDNARFVYIRLIGADQFFFFFYNYD